MTFTMKLPDVGEGVAEAEIVEWHVAVGDEVTPESPLVEVLTDKATVEISPPVAGVIVALHGEPGDILAVGSDLVEIDAGDEAAPAKSAGVAAETGATRTESDTDAAAAAADDDAHEAAADPAGPDPNTPDDVDLPPPSTPPVADAPSDEPIGGDRPAVGGQRVLAAPAVRRRATELGIDLATVSGTGPEGRVVHADLDRLLVRSEDIARSPGGHAEPVRGIRRRIAERLTAAWTEIPHITYVEAIDVTELERLRHQLNTDDAETRLTILPFLTRAVAIACREQPGLNAHYDHASTTLTTFDEVHVGIATQTDSGLMVPVVRHAHSRTLHDLASEIARVSSAARQGSATRDELSGSTITITSLGAIGGVATTPILNAPEVAIIGVNKIEVRPTWIDGVATPRQVMNLSSSFDHRMVDGWDAATFVQRIKRLVESPALLFVERPDHHT